ncbi:MAG: DUF3501 family protein [Conexivisphaera sp.]
MRPEDFLPPEEYGKVRDEELERIVEHKRKRRVDYGDRLSFLFEDEYTVRHQVQEVIYMESIRDRREIEDLIATYEPMVPGEDEISLTAFYLIYDEKGLEEFNGRMAGWESAIKLLSDGRELEEHMAYDDYDPSRPKAVAYLKFGVPPELRDGAVTIRVDHPALSAEIRTPLRARELMGGAARS